MGEPWLPEADDSFKRSPALLCQVAMLLDCPAAEYFVSFQ